MTRSTAVDDGDLLYGDDMSDGTFNESDTLFGDGGNDTAYGEGGNDTLYGGEGDDTLYGGDGSADRAAFSGDLAGYDVTFNADGSILVEDTDTSNGDDGTDTLFGIEELEFNGVVAVPLFTAGDDTRDFNALDATTFFPPTDDALGGNDVITLPDAADPDAFGARSHLHGRRRRRQHHRWHGRRQHHRQHRHRPDVRRWRQQYLHR